MSSCWGFFSLSCAGLCNMNQQVTFAARLCFRRSANQIQASHCPLCVKTVRGCYPLSPAAALASDLSSQHLLRCTDHTHRHSDKHMHTRKWSQKGSHIKNIEKKIILKGQKVSFEFNQTAKLANLSEQRDKVRSIFEPAASLHNSCYISTLKWGKQCCALGSGHMRC